MRLDAIKDIADEVVRDYDELSLLRPQWLRDLPAALDTREKYYLFLWELLVRTSTFYDRPGNCVEIGTRQGTAALHMAHALSQPFVPGSNTTIGTVLTVDIEPGCKPLVEGIAAKNGIKNLVAMTADSSKAVIHGTIDLLFIDGNHTFVSAFGDYVRFRPRVKEGGLIVFDDTRLTPEMTEAWNRITDPKIELPNLHYMGFGVAVKSSSAPQPIWP